METVAAVIVTYNRLLYLKKTVNALRNQTRKLDTIIVIDNNATDGTAEWLDSQKDLFVIHQENLGGSGGFCRGIEEAYKKGYDWIWCMDDDVYPKPECLENLLSIPLLNAAIRCPRRIMNGKPFQGEYTKLNLSSFLVPFHEELTPIEYYLQNQPFDIMGMAFEGPLINRHVVEQIGYPEKELFIFFDDTEYSLRAINKGISVVVVPTAVLDKECFSINKTKSEIRKISSWKLFYEIRNNSYIHLIYGSNWFVKKIKPLGLLFKYNIIFIANIFNDKYSFKDLISWQRAYFDGQRRKLGRK